MKENRYLLATDGSEHAARAQAYAERILNPSTDEIIVVCVVSKAPSESLGPIEDTTALQNRLLEAAEDMVETVAGSLKEHGFEVTMETPLGEPGEELCNLARDRNTEAIILGRRGGGAVKEALMGSVSHYVVHHAPCPVLVVPQRS